VLPQLRQIRGRALDLVFPPHCVGCGREGDFLCSRCRGGLSFLQPPLCPRCGRPQLNGNLCPACVGAPSALEGMRAPLVFEGVVRTAVHQFKYKNLRALAAPLAALMDEYLIRHPLPGEVLVPVPLHPKRLRERGYNQSALLARELGRRRGISVAADCLVRREARSPQARTLGVAERRANVAGAFGCRDGRLAGKAVILIDDVATTGATLEACAAALREGGVASAWGFTLAREI